VVVATDIPLTHMQVNRVCRRAALGLGRVGSYGAHSSGEIIIGFSTANEVSRLAKHPQMELRAIRDTGLDPVYKAVIEATEESILNSLTRAVTMEGVNNNRVPAIDLELLKQLYGRYNSVTI
jgi:D-aminopeptidase